MKKRNLHRVIYTSSPDRGLDILLKLWPKVKEAVFDAELHNFYGWELFDMAYRNNPASMMWKEEVVKGLRQQDVYDHGRVPQEQLVSELKKSGIWAYPTYFGEINCISALKAQYYGCEPVVINYAALRETVQFGRKVEGDIYEKETQEAFVRELIDALTNPMSDEKRSEMSTWAEQFKWSEVAKTWNELFQEKLEKEAKQQ